MTGGMFFASCQSVDPFEPSRVWWFARPKGTHVGHSPLFGTPTGIPVEGTPQVYRLVLDDEGNAVKFTAGYPADREIGNTGGAIQSARTCPHCTQYVGLSGGLGGGF